MTAIVGVTLIDGTGAPPMERAVILVEDGRIARAGRASEISLPPGVDVIDLEGMVVLPGLIDCHVHLWGARTANPTDHVFMTASLKAARATADARRLLEAGFTTVRECGGSATALGLRDAIAEGSIPGPRIIAAGQYIEPTGGADDPSFVPLAWTRSPGYEGPRLADGPDQIRAAVREQLRAGSDFIKTCSTGAAMVHAQSDVDALEWTAEELAAMAGEAHRKRVRLAVHAHGAAGIKQAVEAGADSIEHGTFIDEEGAAMMAARGTYLVPTFFAMHELATRGGEYGAPDYVLRKAAALDGAHNETFALALAAGVPIAMGTDCTGTPVGPHGPNARELAFMVAAGMSPMAAILAATANAARLLGVDGEVGAVETGKQADLIAVTGDPLRDITAVCGVQWVMQAGEIVGSRVG